MGPSRHGHAVLEPRRRIKARPGATEDDEGGGQAGEHWVGMEKHEHVQCTQCLPYVCTCVIVLARVWARVGTLLSGTERPRREQRTRREKPRSLVMGF